jgi:[ribosomal protein S5]-alanine N-acetyltransferase
MNLSNLKITTERLLLVPIDMSYADIIFQEFTPEITTYMGPKSPDKIEETQEFITNSIEEMKAGTDIIVVILNKETKEFLGCSGMHRITTKTPETGIWIKKSAHGNKYGREAVTSLKEWTDKNFSYDHIIYPVDKDNVGSRKIAESLGGEIKAEQKVENMSGNILNEVIYWIYPKKVRNKK